jgi:hypothetical protein
MTASNTKDSFYRTDDVVDLVQKFETCILPHSDWNHVAHLTVAIWYLSQFSQPEAIARICTGIRRYNHCNSIQMTKNSGYHETLTLFWIAIARRFLSTANPNASVLELVNDFILTYGNKKSWFLEYYSYGLIMSWEARQRWVEPDFKPLDE